LSAKREMLRRDLKLVGWRGKKAKRPRGLTLEEASRRVELALLRLKALDARKGDRPGG
jgi:hypothetical protein